MHARTRTHNYTHADTHTHTHSLSLAHLGRGRYARQCVSIRGAWEAWDSRRLIMWPKGALHSTSGRLCERGRERVEG